MAIPIYLWLYDNIGNQIKGSVNVLSRNHSIEVVALRHMIELPTDLHTGNITGTRIHQPVSFDKEIDSSSPYIYQALTQGRTLKSAEFKYYRINGAGYEEHYFSLILDGVKVESTTSLMYDIYDAYGEKRNHIECVDLDYEKITWLCVDGNIRHTDSINECSAA
ncbi:type VI secretion system tube protein TssD [Sodalis sp. dw_96]|uniref:type VI secretion system tube protein TssD n=1 Tax=Sodalis sp. dw_96 TaxID=2719794 RepID=UPI001BD69BF5|nr:type VI secretion system tube protein TssD [Sodalis sp. dw_96]